MREPSVFLAIAIRINGRPLLHKSALIVYDWSASIR
jgi:hypothetical protein